MKIQTDVTRADIFKFNLYTMPRSLHTYYLFGGLLVVFIIMDILSGRPLTLANFIVTIFVCIVTTLLMMALSLVTSFFIATKKNNVLGTHIMHFSKDGFEEKTAQSEGFQNWHDIDNVIKTASSLLLKKGILYHIIPKRSFENTQAYEDFALTITDYWQKARSGERTARTDDKMALKLSQLDSPLMELTTTVNRGDQISYSWHSMTRSKALYLFPLLLTFMIEAIIPHTDRAASALALLLTKVIMFILIYLVCLLFILVFTMLLMALGTLGNKGLYKAEFEKFGKLSQKYWQEAKKQEG